MHLLGTVVAHGALGLAHTLRAMLTCSDAGINDYTVVRELLKEAAQTHSIAAGPDSKGFKGLSAPYLLQHCHAHARTCSVYADLNGVLPAPIED